MKGHGHHVSESSTQCNGLGPRRIFKCRKRSGPVVVGNLFKTSSYKCQKLGILFKVQNSASFADSSRLHHGQWNLFWSPLDPQKHATQTTILRSRDLSPSFFSSPCHVLRFPRFVPLYQFAMPMSTPPIKSHCVCHAQGQRSDTSPSSPSDHAFFRSLCNPS